MGKNQKNPVDGGSIPPAPVLKMKLEKKRFLTAISILIGTAVGAGILGIPYVASKAGFFIALFYIFILGGIILLVNLCLGEVVLRTKEKHQLAGYVQKYLGKNAKRIMEFAVIFGVYSAIVAYLFGVGESLSFLIFGNLEYSVLFGVSFGAVMSGLIWTGLKYLKKFERIGVAAILVLLLIIFFVFIDNLNFGNLRYVNFDYALLPFGVVLFAMFSFHAIPQISFVLKNKKHMKKVLFTGSIISVVLYSLFAFVVVGSKGFGTPEIATLALGSIFVLFGIFAMFTSYLSLGNALEEDFIFDDHFRRRKSWLLSSIIPICIYVFISFFEFFSFTKILSIGGVVSGGIMAVLVLFLVKKSKEKGDRIPEYSVSIKWILIFLLALVFIAGVVRELWVALV